MHMLKVTVHDDPGSPLRICVEGKLTAPWTGELESCWKSHPAEDGRKLIVDLTEEDYAEAAGRYLLAWMQAAGVQLFATTLPMQELLAGIDAGAASPSRRRSHHR